jgi:hypothetical protein
VARRETLLTQLAAKTPIAPEDEEWLDQAGNAVDEIQALNLLKKASDYERGYDRLSDKLKAAVQRLREFAGDVVKISGKKRKHTCCSQKVQMISHLPIETENKLKGFEKKTSAQNRKEDAAVPVFTKKEIATLTQRIEILDWHHKNGKNQRRTAAHFDKCYPNLILTQPLISKWLKNEEKWRQ